MKIPPLDPLKVFEVVARTGNLTLAASELNVSQSAVSRQVAVLEEYLGVQLFTRERVGVRLTEVGEGYARRIGPAFGEIAAATEAITRKYSNNVIRLRTYTTLTARWLIPRLPHFKARHPEVEVSILNSTAPLDFGAEQCALAIVLGDGPWPGAEAALLLEAIAIGQQHMLEADFQAGRLVRPFARPLRTGKGHYLVTPALQRYSGKIAAFKDWLMVEAINK